ncbi:MAG: hypothetical protein KDK03_02665 [Rhodobacteraceae bacterium]|nr:hypothetical protein [Paracoccaceae bacterium]
MRIVVMVAFAGLALWRAWIDWQATIGEGYAFRLASIDRVFAENAPGSHAKVVSILQNFGPDWLWDPVFTTLFSLPLALIPALIAGILWLTRPRGRGRG